jgi:hypothetical protein
MKAGQTIREGMSLEVRRQHRKEDGAITVFLSLVLLLILSLVMTVLESARVHTARLFAERALTTAMDSVLAEFYDPLFKEYHLLALEAGYGQGGIRREEIEKKLKEYMSYTFTPNRDLTHHKEGLELYNISVASLRVTETAGLMDYGGDLFLNEAVEYMKYRELGDGIALLLDKMSVLKKPEKVSVLYEEKLKVEEELITIDEGLLKLMMLYDGISTTEKGLRVNKDGALQTVPDFIKMICYEPVTKETVGINNDSIFAAAAGNYINPDVSFSNIDQYFQKLDLTLKRIRELETEIAACSQQISDAGKTLEELKANLEAVKKDKEAAKEAKAQVKACQDYISDLDDQLEAKQLAWTSCETEKSTIIYELQSRRDELALLTQTLQLLISNAASVIDEIVLTAEKAEGLIAHYEGSIKGAREELGEEIYSTMEEGLAELNKYRGDKCFGYDFPGMKQVLQQDLEILMTTADQLLEAGTALDNMDFSLAKECFTRAGDTLRAYRIDKLTLDYSSLVIQKSSSDDPLGLLGDLVKDGLTGLVTDPSEVSEAELNKGTLPSDLASLAGETGSGFDFGALFKSMVIGGKESGLKGLFGNFGEYDFTSTLGTAANMAAEHLLFQAYIQEHFYHLPMEGEDISNRLHSALKYEQEYLLMGKASDKENLNAILLQLILIRTILNFTSLLGDKAKWTEARTIAIGLVGFMGLPILVSITQTILVVLLAFAEALVDTCALLQGKEVSILKKKVFLSFSELLSLGREYIRTKAAAYPEGKGILALSYGEFLSIFLFLKDKGKLSYRCMDLIQENIRLRYEDDFSLQSCIFGFHAEADFNITSKFIALDFVKKHTAEEIDGYIYPVVAGCSY